MPLDEPAEIAHSHRTVEDGLLRVSDTLAREMSGAGGVGRVCRYQRASYHLHRRRQRLWGITFWYNFCQRVTD